MAKGQQKSNKETQKPKKAAPSKPAAGSKSGQVELKKYKPELCSGKPLLKVFKVIQNQETASRTNADNCYLATNISLKRLNVLPFKH